MNAIDLIGLGTLSVTLHAQARWHQGILFSRTIIFNQKWLETSAEGEAGAGGRNSAGF